MTTTTVGDVTVRGISTGGPEHEYRQGEVRSVAASVYSDTTAPAHLSVFENAAIDRRRFAMPLEWYATPHGFGERNDAYRRVALQLAEEHARRAIEAAGWSAEDVDAVVFVSSTGVSTPSLDADLVGRLGLRTSVARLPLFGLGCAGGAAGLARAADLVRAGYEHVLLVAVELCSTTFVLDDDSAANFIGTALFADGCAAVTVGPAAGRGPELAHVLHAHSLTVPDTSWLTGWDVQDEGFRLRLAKEIPEAMAAALRPAVDDALETAGWKLDDLDAVALHPGGAKVITGYQAVLGLSDDLLDPVRTVLREHGNMSSPTVLFVLDELLRRKTTGNTLMSASGPGFALEHLLLWLP
ncbi:type III polyketide synthase [Spongisporangium articulatum]|uniref:Type III polyketide synthase n=1 Tax=Spongisporangium articulatum TaxID=3362603 RepID=A0ABW8ATK8_9ACTN